MNTATFADDIPHATAQAAYSGISFTPEKRATQTRDDYAATLASDYAELKASIGPEMQATLDAEFARYREGYRKRYLAKLASDSRCVSWMIAGPSNFPVRRMEKRNRVAHKRLEELLDFRKRALDAIYKTLHPELRPIMSGDSDAVERLRAKIEQAERQQERMKTANSIIRKFFKDKPAGVAALVAVGWTDEQARRLLTEPDCFGGYGFASFELTNNGANIRRMRERLAALERAKTAPEVQVEGDKARVEDCPAENRVRLFFPGKPDADVRGRLKSGGFRWAPSLGCWQAYRHPHTMAIARKEAGLDGAA